MRYQDQLIQDTKAAIDALFKAAHAMPADKLIWKVSDKGRTALSQCAECAQMIPMTIGMLETKTMPPMDENAMEQMGAQSAAWTLADCERICREESEKLYVVLRNYSDEDLAKPIDLPFGDKDWRMTDVASYPLWNITYHLGQISFIQTLYGDNEMYF
jgi:hypothetical protein